MEVVLLGTGSGDGWPSPYCRCASCLAARADGELHTPSAVLIDGILQIDLGPEAGRQALRAGTDLADVKAVLITHVHPDHCDPAALLYRGWSTDAPLVVAGPPPVIAACAPWLDPAGGPVTLRPLTAGDVVRLAGYEVRVLPAAHDAFGECCLYDVTAPDAARLLYATDTGPWPEGFRESVTGLTPYDLVLLDETYGDRPREGGHHDLVSFAGAIGDLREWGLADQRTRIVATHLSHHNPAPAVLRVRLQELGVQLGADLNRLVVAARS